MHAFGHAIGDNVTLLFFDCVAYLRASGGTAAGGWFDWGGTPSIKKQRRPKLNSSASEMRFRGLKTNVGLTVSLTKWEAGAKAWLNEQRYLSV